MNIDRDLCESDDRKLGICADAARLKLLSLLDPEQVCKATNQLGMPSRGEEGAVRGIFFDRYTTCAAPSTSVAAFQNNETCPKRRGCGAACSVISELYGDARSDIYVLDAVQAMYRRRIYLLYGRRPRSIICASMRSDFNMSPGDVGVNIVRRAKRWAKEVSLADLAIHINRHIQIHTRFSKASLTCRPIAFAARVTTARGSYVRH